jgi:Fe-S cluster biosynthesis and repair protein YggX
MTTTVQCIKCGEEKPTLAAPPFRAGTKLADLGLEIQQKICAPCYRDWINMSVKLVNEMRMDTTDPRGQELWLKQMKLFLNLDGASTDPWSRHLDKPVVIETTDGVRARATLLGATADALTLADFEGGAIPAGFEASSGVRGSATIARDSVKTLEPAA